MLIARNMLCCVLSTWLPGPAAAVIAQPPPSDAAASRDQLRTDQALAGFDRLRGWIDRFETPPIENPASALQLDGASSVCIVLRRSGRVMGVGSDASGDHLMLRRAAGLALNQVLADPALASLTARLLQQEREQAQDALSVDQLRANLGQTLAIELEIGGKLAPLVGRTVEQVASKIQPGLDGLALRQGQSWEYLFPAQMRATNTGGEPVKLLLNVALRAGLPIKDFGELTARDDIGLYRFHTLTLWQGEPVQAPARTFRGDILVQQADVNRQSLARFADALAMHLMRSMWPDPPPMPLDEAIDGPQGAPAPPQRLPVGIMGDYRPASDQYRPLIAPPLEQALAAFALAQYGRAAATEFDAQLQAQALKFSLQILNDLAIVTPAEDDPRASLPACAAIIYAVSELPDARAQEPLQSLVNDAARLVMQSFDPASGFVDRAGADGQARSIPPHAQSLLAGAMARLLAAPAGESERPQPELVRQAIDAAWSSVPASQHVGLLPWIGWAEEDVALATKQPLSNEEHWRLLLMSLDQARIAPAIDIGESTPDDLIGGFALTSEASASGTPSATAQTVRPAAWVASILNQTLPVPPDQLLALRQQHLHTVRFLMQLAVRESNRGIYRNHERAVGGIRAAVWDSDQPVAAQALGLVTAVQTLLRSPELR